MGILVIVVVSAKAFSRERKFTNAWVPGKEQSLVCSGIGLSEYKAFNLNVTFFTSRSPLSNILQCIELSILLADRFNLRLWSMKMAWILSFSPQNQRSALCFTCVRSLFPPDLKARNMSVYILYITHTYIYIIYTCIRCTYVSYDIFIWDPWMHLSWSLSSFIIFEANLNTPITSHLRHVVHICLNVCTWPPCGNPARSRLPMAQIFATETILSSTWRHRRAAAAQLNQRLPRRPKQRCKATQRLRKDYTKPLQSSCKDCSAIGKT